MDMTEIEIIKNMTAAEKAHALATALKNAFDLIEPWNSVQPLYEASRPLQDSEGPFSRGVWYGEVRTYIEQAQDALRRARYRLSRNIDNQEQ
jgi:hypothetical protein